MKIQQWKIDRVAPYPGNPRLNDDAVDPVAASIREFGFRQPIVVDRDGVIICGHTRHRAAQQLGLTTVPVHVAAELNPTQVKALRLTDNRCSQLAEWDWEKLAAEVADLQGDDVDIAQFGFTPDFLAEMLDFNALQGLTDEDAIPPVPKKAKTKRGDLWILGDHRLLCGDSASRDDVDRLLAGAKVQLVHTDPPYNVAVQPRGDGPKKGGELRAKDRPLANDSMPAAEFDAVLLKWFGNIMHALEPGCAFYIWGGYANAENYPRALRSVGAHFAQVIVWIKEHPVLSRNDYNGNFELCSYGWAGGEKHRFFGPTTSTDTWELSRAVEGSCKIGKGVRIEAVDGARVDILPPNDDRNLRTIKLEDDTPLSVNVFNAPADVWRVKKVPGQKMVHLTEKPVELSRRALQNSTKLDDGVLDLFGGSGSTLIGAQQLKRRAYVMELDPLYCDVIVKRWEDFTGKKAYRYGEEKETEGRRGKAAAAKTRRTRQADSGGAHGRATRRAARQSRQPTGSPSADRSSTRSRRSA